LLDSDVNTLNDGVHMAGSKFLACPHGQASDSANEDTDTLFCDDSSICGSYECPQRAAGYPLYGVLGAVQPYRARTSASTAVVWSHLLHGVLGSTAFAAERHQVLNSRE